MKTLPFMYHLLILTKLRWLQLFSTSQNKSQNSISNLKNLIFECSFYSTREDLLIDASITNEGLILTKIWVISFLGVRTDRHNTGLEYSYGNMSAHKNFNSKLKIRRTGVHDKSTFLFFIIVSYYFISENNLANTGIVIINHCIYATSLIGLRN